MDFWDAKSVDFSWKGKTGALHKTRAYGIMVPSIIFFFGVAAR